MVLYISISRNTFSNSMFKFDGNLFGSFISASSRIYRSSDHSMILSNGSFSIMSDLLSILKIGMLNLNCTVLASSNCETNPDGDCEMKGSSRNNNTDLSEPRVSIMRVLEWRRVNNSIWPGV